MQKWAQSLDWEDPLEKEMATHSRVLAWEIPWIEEPGRLQSMGSQRVVSDSLQPLDCSTPGSSVPGIFQVRILFKQYSINSCYFTLFLRVGSTGVA